jgi:hypothetical protein
MRKEAVCVLVVLLGGGWSQAQLASPGPASAASAGLAPPPPAADPGGYGVTPANYYPNDGTYPAAVGYNYPAGYPTGYGYADPGYGYGYGVGYQPGASYGAGFNYAYGTGYPAGFDPGAPGEVTDGDQGPKLPSKNAVCYTWADFSYLASWARRAPLSTPLVTSGSAADAHPGAIGQPGTGVVFGTDSIDFGLRQGIQGELGVYLDADHHLSLDASGFYFFPQYVRSTFASDANGNPVIARPEFNTAAGGERSFLTSFPGVLAGSTSVESRSTLWGYEVNGRYSICPSDGVLIDGLIGYRQARLDEKITITDQLTPLIPGNLTFLGGNNFVNPPGTIGDQDLFGTANIFYGVNLGVRARWLWDWGYLNVYAKTAVGVTSERVSIQGSTSLLTPTGTTSTPGGILALPSNIGNYHQSEFSVIPEVGFTFAYNPIDHVRLTAGYSFTYWSNVVRPGDQINNHINPALVPTDVGFGTATGGSGPTFAFHETSFWWHTLNAGVEFYY